MKIDKFCACYKKLGTIGEEKPEIYTGEFEYEAVPGTVKELIEFWWKCPRCCFLRSVENLVNDNEIEIKDIDVIICAHGGDHG